MADSPDDLDAVRKHFAKTVNMIADKRETYAEREAYYRGTNGEVMASELLERAIGRYGNGKHFGLTYAAVPVDALMDRVDLSGLVVVDDEATSKRLKEALWDENDLDDEADDFHTKAGYLGDYYVLLWPDDDAGEGEKRTIDVLGKHPKNAAILYDSMSERDPICFVFAWREGKDTWRANQVYDNIVYEWIAEDSTDMPEGRTLDKWLPVSDADAVDGRSTQVNEWGWPVMHFRPDSKPYGTPVNARGYGAQDAITKLNASDMATIDYIVLPQRYALLDPEAAEDDDIDQDFNSHELLDGPTQDYDPSRITSRQGGKLKSQPGSTWALRGVKSVGQFDPIVGTPFQDREQFQIRSMAVLTRTPLYEFMPESDNSPSGEARRRADGSITKHAKKITGSFGREWAKGGEIALKMLGIGDEKSVEAVWLPAEVSTDQEGITLISLKTQNGIPLEQALKEAGYTDEQVAEWLPNAADDEAVTISIDMLKTLAPALQALGQAVTLGSITAEDARIIIEPWAKGAAPEDAPPLNDVKLGVGLDGLPVAPPVVPGAPTPPGVPPAPPKGVMPPQLAPTALPPAPGKMPAPVG